MTGVPHEGSRVLETDRLLLREFTLADAEAFYRMGSDPAVIEFTGDPGGGFRDLEHATEVLISHPLEDYRRHGFGRWACVHREEGRVIGFAGPKFLPELGEVDLGYRLFPEYWGRGLATEAARAVLDHGFRALRLEEIIALVLPGNVASIRVLKKVGMRPAGRMDAFGLEVLRFEARPGTLPGGRETAREGGGDAPGGGPRHPG